MCHSNSNWVDALPVVLLGLRTSFKEDIQALTAELLYGKTLRIPGEFFDHEDMPSNPCYFIEPFRKMMQQIRPRPTAHHIRNKTFVYKDLYTCTHVFLRDDTVRRPLEQPYSGPHRIIKRISDRVFSINVEGQVVNVSTDRLKPAYITQEEQPVLPDRSTSETTHQEATDGISCSSSSNSVQPNLNLKTYPRKIKKTVQFSK